MSSTHLLLLALLGSLLPAAWAIRLNISSGPSRPSNASNATLDLGATASLGAQSNMCAEYTTSNYRGCPNGKVCTSVYKPGKDYCNAFSCWAWTLQRYCEEGDIDITSVMCAWSCPSQPVCGVCSDPCDPVATHVQVIPTSYPTTPESITPTASSVSSTTMAINRGSVPQTFSLTFDFTFSVKATMSFTKAFSFSEQATANLNLPLIGQAGLEFGSSQTFTTNQDTTSAQSATMTLDISQQIPAYTAQNVTATAALGTVIAKIPVLVVSTFTCNKASSTEQNSAVISTTGALLSQASQVRLEYGATAPAYPDNILPQADDSCASNPLCALNGITTGRCCPNALGAYNACCSFCFAKPACAAFAQHNRTMCCPSRGNVLNTCCT